MNLQPHAPSNVIPLRTEAPRRRRFAFLAHMLDASSLVHFDPALATFSEAQLQGLLDSWQGLIRPAVVGRTTVHSVQGDALDGEFIALFVTTQQMLELSRDEILSQLQEAVDIAIEHGADIIGLGGYTSIVSQGGRLLNAGGVPLTTGNSYTAATALQAVEKAAALRGRRLDECRVAIVGAAGSIGAALTQALGSRVGSLALVGNPANPTQTLLRLQGLVQRLVDAVMRDARRGAVASDARGLAGEVLQGLREGRSVAEMAERLTQAGATAPVACSVSLPDVMPQADVIIACTSSPEVLITPAMVKRDAIICDLSVPHNLPRSFVDERPDVLLFDGGVMRVPGRPDLGWRFGLEKGQAFACMCETMLIGLEPERLKRCAGAVVSVENIALLNESAHHHGFELEDFRCFGEVTRIDG